MYATTYGCIGVLLAIATMCVFRPAIDQRPGVCIRLFAGVVFTVLWPLLVPILILYGVQRLAMAHRPAQSYREDHELESEVSAKAYGTQVLVSKPR